MTAESLRELDELKSAWQALDRKLEREHALNLARFKYERMRSVRGALLPLAIGQIAQAIGSALLAAAFVSFWVAYHATPHLLAMGLLGQAWAISMVLFAGRDLHTISQIEYGAPVLAIQKRIAELRARRVRAAPFFAVSACLMWLPATLVIFRMLFADVWAQNPEVMRLLATEAWLQNPERVTWFVATVLAPLVPLLAFLRWSRKPSRAQLAKKVNDSFAGRSVLRVEAILGELAEFERE